MAENGIMDAGYKVFFGCLLYNSDATEVGIVVRIEDAPRNAVKMTTYPVRRGSFYDRNRSDLSLFPRQFSDPPLPLLGFAQSSFAYKRL